MKEIDTGLLLGLTDVSSYNKMQRKKREMKREMRIGNQ